MDVVVFAVVLLALAAFVSAPLYRRGSASGETGSGPDVARRESLLQALKELEIDKASGLLSQTEYERERRVLETEAAD